MPLPHDKCPLRIAKMRLLVLLMQHKCFRSEQIRGVSSRDAVTQAGLNAAVRQS